MNKVRTSGLNHGYSSNVNSWINLGATTTISAGTAYSVMAWLKPSDLVENYFIGASSNSYMAIKSSTTVDLKHNGVDDVFTISELTVDEWVHIAFIRNTSNLVTIYINGTAQADTKTANQLFQYRYLGNRQNGDYAFRGAVDDMAIYNGTELSATQVLRNYKAGKGPSDGHY